MTVSAAGRFVPFFQRLIDWMSLRKKGRITVPRSDVPDHILRDVGLGMDEPTDRRENEFWQHSRQLGHRSLPF